MSGKPFRLIRADENGYSLEKLTKFANRFSLGTHPFTPSIHAQKVPGATKFVVRGRLGGKCVRKYLPMKREAETWAEIKNIEARNQGRRIPDGSGQDRAPDHRNTRERHPSESGSGAIRHPGQESTREGESHPIEGGVRPIVLRKTSTISSLFAFAMHSHEAHAVGLRHSGCVHAYRCRNHRGIIFGTRQPS